MIAQNFSALSAAVYTQITDVETECNGLLTYDRLLKADPARIRAANGALIANAYRAARGELAIVSSDMCNVSPLVSCFHFGISICGVWRPG